MSHDQIRMLIKTHSAGKIQILPIGPMPNELQWQDAQAWHAYWQWATKRYGPVQDGQFYHTALGYIYQMDDDYLAVFGLDVRPGLDDHTIRIIPFAHLGKRGKIMLLDPCAPIEYNPQDARSILKYCESLPRFPMIDWAPK